LISMLGVITIGIPVKLINHPLVSTIGGIALCAVYGWMAWLFIQWQSREMWYDLRAWWRAKHRARKTPTKTETRDSPPRGTTEIFNPKKHLDKPSQKQ